MTDKEKIKEELERRMYDDYNSGEAEVDCVAQGVCASMIQFIDSMQEEPISVGFKEALTEAITNEWKDYNDRGAATVDALEDNTQELSFAKGFYRGAKWGKNQTKVEIQAQSMALAHGCPKEHISEELEKACEQLSEKARKHKAETISPFFSPTDYEQGVIDGANWKVQQMMAKAIRGRVSVNIESNYHRLIYGCWDMDDALENCNEGDRVKVIVIKEG